MVSSSVVALARRNIAIDGRYDKQEMERVGGKSKNLRKDWTPAQKRRMKKKRNKPVKNRIEGVTPKIAIEDDLRECVETEMSTAGEQAMENLKTVVEKEFEHEPNFIGISGIIKELEEGRNQK